MTSPVILIETRKFSDTRGWFSESYSQRQWAKYGVPDTFVQDNHSFSEKTGTIRGIHFQSPPHAQAKLVRCTQGAIYDIAVDLRRGSPTYGHYVGETLSAENGLQQYIPVGFGHAFITLAPNTEVAYKITDYYAPETEQGIRWDCPSLDINWKISDSDILLSEKDRYLPTLDDFESPFTYQGNPLLKI